MTEQYCQGPGIRLDLPNCQQERPPQHPWDAPNAEVETFDNLLKTPGIENYQFWLRFYAFFSLLVSIVEIQILVRIKWSDTNTQFGHVSLIGMYGKAVVDVGTFGICIVALFAISLKHLGAMKVCVWVFWVNLLFVIGGQGFGLTYVLEADWIVWHIPVFMLTIAGGFTTLLPAIYVKKILTQRVEASERHYYRFDQERC